jgi:hypothetical protein
LAAGDRGFLFDRFAFPWNAEPNRQLEPEKKRMEEKLRRESEATPGMLLFRWPFDKQDDLMSRFELLAVRLVPENPSSGVNGEAFEAAVTFAKENGASAPLAILGPSFSSSAESLRNAMDRHTGFRYVIRTGSATVPEAWKRLGCDIHTFAATVRDDDQASEALFQHLGVAGDWQKAGRVAILSESGTLYGAHASSSQKEARQNVRKHAAACSSQESQQKEAPQGAQKDAQQGEVLLNLVFPRGISWLRNAYQDLPAAPPGYRAVSSSPLHQYYRLRSRNRATATTRPPASRQRRRLSRKRRPF